MNINKRIKRILALSITSLVLILLMAVPIAASGIPESSGILESLGIVESSDIIDSSDILESSGNPESPAVQESSGEPESPTIQESSEESESPTVQESLDYLETSTDPEISVDPGVPDDPETEEKLEVHFIDVGQGDATLISCDGHHMLIDGGNKGDSSRIFTYLRNHGVTQLDYIVATHGDADHVGGLPGALQAVGPNIGTVFAPYETWKGTRFSIFTARLSELGKQIKIPRTGDVYDLGSGTFTIISAGGNESNECIMLRFVYRDSSFLFAGDSERKQENTVVSHFKNNPDDLQSTVLKVPHHGSDDSSTYSFLRAVQPSVAVISSGRNGYGHPSEGALSRLRGVDARVIRTDKDGDVVITYNDGKLCCSADRKISQYDNLIPYGKPYSLYKGTKAEAERDSTGLTFVIDLTDKSGDEEESEPEGGIADESVSDSEPESGSGRSGESASGSEREGASGSESESGSRHSDKSVSESGGESVSGSGGESRTSEEEYTYILNKSTMKFHYDYCSYIKNGKPENKETVTTTRKAVLADGYDPCGHCNP